MNEDVNNTPAPEGGSDGGPLPEVREAGGMRRPMNATEARVFRERQEAMKSKPAPKPAEGEGPGEEQPTEQHQEEAEEPQGEKTESGLTIPDLVPQEFREETTANVELAGQLATEIGMEQGTVQEIVDFAVGSAVTDESHVDISDADACRVTLRSMYGDEANKIIDDAQKAVQRLGPKVAEYLDNTSLGNAPSVLLALALYQQGVFHLSPAAAQRELDALTKGEDLRSKPYYNSDHPGHKLAVAKASALYQRIAAKGKSVEAAPKAEAAKKEIVSSEMAKLDAEIKAVTSDPAYRKEDDPRHKEVAARAAELYRRRWPE